MPAKFKSQAVIRFYRILSGKIPLSEMQRSFHSVLFRQDRTLGLSKHHRWSQEASASRISVSPHQLAVYNGVQKYAWTKAHHEGCKGILYAIQVARSLSTASFLNQKIRPISPISLLKSCWIEVYSTCCFPISSASARKDNTAQASVFHSLVMQRNFNSEADVEGPIVMDYSAIIPEEEFQKLADDLLHNLQEKLEEYGDDLQVEGFDIDYASGVLTLKLGDLGTYVINKQTPNRQIWLSSPVSGPARFDWDKENKAWIYRRTKANLIKLLEMELSNLLNAGVTLL